MIVRPRWDDYVGVRIIPADTVPDSAVEGIRRGAEDVGRIVAPVDIKRLVILPDHDSTRWGSSIGSGHRMATAAGHPGATAVRVNARKLVDLLEPEGADPVTLTAARAMVEHVTIHELAHAIIHDIDPAADADEARDWIDGADYRDAGEGFAVRWHPPTWATVYAVLASRLLAIRSERERRFLRPLVAADLKGFGHDFDMLADIYGDLPDHVCLRHWAASIEQSAIVAA